jgi:hypothetical protein
MPNNVVRLDHRAAAARVEDYLGPAEVDRAAGHEVFVRLPAGGPPVRVELALAFPYEPAPGDVILVIGKGEAYFAIGVLKGTGRSVLSLPGDVALHAEGELHLSGGKGVRVTAPEIELYADKMRAVAGTVVQTFTSMFQRVSELLSVHAGESHTLVEGASYAQSKSAAIVTQETVTINGDEIHLG